LILVAQVNLIAELTFTSNPNGLWWNLKRRRPLALVLLSGGLDSAVALYWALSKGYRVDTLAFNYFRRSRKEIEAAKGLSRIVKSVHYEINLEFLKEIEDSSAPTNRRLLSAPSAYIPSRNLIFYGIASSISELIDARYIVGGHNIEDVSAFPDSSEKFFREFNKATAIGLLTKDKTGRVILPLSNLSKAGVIELGAKLGVPFELTWSCYKENEFPCGNCHACVMREMAFRSLGITDPLRKEPMVHP
jgi:7-cyano-7-deazaguanine synthase